MVRADEIRQFPVSCEVSEEVRSQGEQHDGSARGIPRSVDERVDERPALVVADGRREELLELIDREHELLARTHALEGGDELRRGSLAGAHEQPLARECREQAGTQQRRLAAARRADEREQRRIRQTCDELLDEPLAAEEELGVARFELGEALVRADVAIGGRGRAPPPVGRERQRRVLREDRPFELLQLEPGLEPELVVQAVPRLPVHLEPVGLPAAAVEREHQLRPETLAERVVGAERFELGHERQVAAERELGVDALLDRGEAQLLEPLGLDPCEPLELEIRKRPSMPQRLGLAQQAGPRIPRRRLRAPHAPLRPAARSARDRAHRARP